MNCIAQHRSQTYFTYDLSTVVLCINRAYLKARYVSIINTNIGMSIDVCAQQCANKQRIKSPHAITNIISANTIVSKHIFCLANWNAIAMESVYLLLPEFATQQNRCMYNTRISRYRQIRNWLCHFRKHFKLPLSNRIFFFSSSFYYRLLREYIAPLAIFFFTEENQIDEIEDTGSNREGWKTKHQQHFCILF